MYARTIFDMTFKMSSSKPKYSSIEGSIHFRKNIKFSLPDGSTRPQYECDKARERMKILRDIDSQLERDSVKNRKQMLRETRNERAHFKEKKIAKKRMQRLRKRRK